MSIMELLLALGDPDASRIAERFRRDFPSLTVTTATSDNELESALAERSYDLVVATDALASRVSGRTSAIARPDALILVVDAAGQTIYPEAADHVEITDAGRIPYDELIAAARALIGDEQWGESTSPPVLLRKAVAAVRTASGRPVRILGAHGGELELDREAVLLLERVVREVLQFALYWTGGGPAAIGLDVSEGMVEVGVTAHRSESSEEVSTNDSSRLRELVNRSEELRAAVNARGGGWNVERGGAGVAIRIRIPAGSGLGATGDSADDPLSVEDFRRAYGDSPEVMREILRLYCDEAPRKLSAIEDGLARSDAEVVAKAAHSLANTSGTLQSKPAVRAARALEAAAREHDMSAAREHTDRLTPIVNAIVAWAERGLER